MRACRRTGVLLVVGLLSLGAFAGVANAAIVDTSCAGGEFPGDPGLQNALDNVNTHDTIVLTQLCTASNSGGSAGAFNYTGDRSFTLEGQPGSGAGFDGTNVGMRMLSIFGASSETALTVSNLIFQNGGAGGSPAEDGGALAFQGDYDVTLSGDTFTNNVQSPGYGGAVAIESYSAVARSYTLSNDTFTNNSATDGQGGALDIVLRGGGTGSIALSGDSFTGNHEAASNGEGGAAYVEANGAPALTLSGDTFTNNATSGGGSGGGLEFTVFAGSMSVTNSTFSGNTTQTSGGALDAFGGPLTVSMTGNSFTGNTVDGRCGHGCELDGGGVSLNNLGGGTPAVTQSANTFSGNQVINGSGVVEGGGEAVIGETLSSTDDLFSGNSIQAPAAGAVSNGSALALASNDCSSTLQSSAVNLAVAGNSIADGGTPADAHGAVSTYCENGTGIAGANQLTLTNSTISGNRGGRGPAPSGGTGGLWGDDLDEATLGNSVLAGNSDGGDLGGFANGGVVTATYTDLCNGSTSTPFTGTGNICANPLLANAPGGDVHETASSPTIDAGSNALVPGGLNTDVYGAQRIQPKFAGGTPIVDMGAAEFPAIVVPVPPPTASIASPTNGAVYTLGQQVPASYSCTEGSGGPGIASCAGNVPSGSPIDTSTTGAHTFTVTATSHDGQTGSASVSYTVTGALSVSIVSPAQRAFYAQGQRVLASYTCAGPGISSCAGPVPSGSPIDTSTTGAHTFTVVATSSSGQARTASVTYTVAGAPSVAIVSPLGGASFIRGNSTAIARFACSEGAAGPGLSSCIGTAPNGSKIDTTTPGPHTFTVIATSADGQVTTASVPYRVVYPSNKPVRPPHKRPHSDGRFIVTVKVPHRGRVDILVTAWKDNFAPGFGPAADIGPPKPVILPPAPGRFVFARAHMTFNSGGTYQIPVNPNAAGRRLVGHHRYRVTLRLWISYTPWGGFPGKLGYFGLHLP